MKRVTLRFARMLLYLAHIILITSHTKAGGVTQANKSTAQISISKIETEMNVNIKIILDFGSDTNIERGLIATASNELFTEKEHAKATIHDPSAYWKYFMATNWFCGPLEMTDRAGEKMPPLRPEVNSETAYPDSYSIQFVRTHMAGRRIWESPYALIPNDRDEAAMREFRLEDYFKIEKPGDYQLTVWPKIYKRSDTNRDICERIDLPPVTIPIKWTGNSQ